MTPSTIQKLGLRRLERLLGETLLVSLAFLLYTIVHALVRGRADEAQRNAAELLDLEQSLGIAVEAPIQGFFLQRPALLHLLNLEYVYGHLPLIAIVAVALYLRSVDSYVLLRNAFLISGAISLVVYYAYPVAPPRLLDGYDYVDTVLDAFEANRPLTPAALVNEYAAMPSLHFGWNLLLAAGLVIILRQPALKLLAILMPAVMLISIVATANHFLLDAVGGLLVVCAGVLIALTLRKQGRRLMKESPLTPLIVWLLGTESGAILESTDEHREQAPA